MINNDYSRVWIHGLVDPLQYEDPWNH